MRRQCLCGCGKLVEGSRCPTSRRAQRAKYDGPWRQDSARMIAAHVATHGWNCPGWKRDSHPSTDLTLDHGPPQRVMCRGCNSRKKGLGDG